MSQGKYLSAEKLSANLKCVIRNGEEARPIASNEVSTTSNPISSECLQEEKVKFQKLAEAERQKRSKSTKRQKTAGGSASTVVPETPSQHSDTYLVTLYSLFYLYFEFPKHDDETLSVPAVPLPFCHLTECSLCYLDAA
jgi:hypothetical protein